MPGLAVLPNEVLEHILLHLDPIDVAQISQCCQLFRLLLYNSKDQFIWRELYLTLPLDDPRTCVSLQGARKHDIDWKTLLQRFIRARAVLHNPSLSRPGERLMILHTLVDLVTWVPPLVGMDDFDNISLNLAWVVAMLRGTFFFEEIELSTSATEEERQLCARLHTYYGLTAKDLTRQGRVQSRAFVYDMRNYCPDNLYGPFNAAGGVNWVHVQALHHLVSMHIVDLHGEDESFQFAIFPMSIQTTQVVLPVGINFNDEEDWAGVSGPWKVSFCFCDHRELLTEYNETKRDANGNLDTSIFEEADFGEVYRTSNVTLKKVSSTPDPDNPTRPIIHFMGEMSDTTTMTGAVKMTTDGQISGENGQAVWHSVGVQVGGMRSMFGVLGTWTTVFHDLDDPVGPFWLRRDSAAPDLPMRHSPSSKPKPGSLRDRIAAFENSSSVAAPAPAPVPRPKPGGSSWKPKSQFPPTFPSTSDVSSDKKPSSMSASDAKESIQTGGTLKERMAALQNRSGFGAPPPVEKPKWKPPPAVAPVDKDDDDNDKESSHDIDPAKLVPPVRKSSFDEMSADERTEENPTGSDQAEDEKAIAVDPEAEEKQRRAAIAARMARLGGARVGRAPMFGRPPSAKKSEVDEPSRFETRAERTDEDGSQKAEAIPSPSTDQSSNVTTSASDEQPIVMSDTVGRPSVPVRKDSGSSPSLSFEAESQTTSSPPLSMPVPSVPRRAAPPRRKAPKTPEAVPLAVDDRVVSESAAEEHAGDVMEVVGEFDQVTSEHKHPTSVVAQGAEELPHVIAKDSTTKVEEPEESIKARTEESFSEGEEPSPVDFAHLPKRSTTLADEQNIAEVVIGNDDQEAAKRDVLPGNDSRKKELAYIEEPDEKQEHVEKEHVEAQPVVGTKEREPVAQAVDEAEEDNEAARRKSVTEKLAKIHGGVSPFAPLPQRQASGSSEDIQTSPSVQKRFSTSRSNADLPPLPLSPQRKQSLHAAVAETLPAAQAIRVQSPESVLENSPAFAPTAKEYTVEPVVLEKRSLISEDGK
ncbi:hypothetical protein C0992_004113 [Termitomyces sp. T32_za158]|nr:hypothetical protein C0992_004113 [Termitomyces sp. T32_za158]